MTSVLRGPTREFRIGKVGMKSAVLALAFVAIAGLARAAGAPPPPAQMQSLIAALSGRWTVTGEFENGPETPNGGAISGEEVWRSGPGGYTFMQEGESLRR